MKIGVIGSGAVGETLANGFLEHGHSVMIGSRDLQKLAKWQQSAKGPASSGSFSDAAKYGDVLVLAVKGTAAEQAVKLAGIADIGDKVILDATNPIADLPPVNGVLQFFTGPNSSLLEQLQKVAPRARFVKAFSCVGSAFMVNPTFPSGKPTMFICGNDPEAKAKATEILTQFGWDTEDMGAAESARAIEPLCMLWCIPGFTHNRWAHAFKMLKG